MTEGIEAITTAAVGLALDAAALRQQAIAANIASAGVEGYTPVTVDFESQLEEARSALESRGRLDAASLSGVRPALETAPLDAMGLPPKVSLDMEVASMAQNSAQYQALVRGLAKHYAMLAAAVSEGKK
jgi:flagellar basal-body rod protein FlgB